MILQQQLGVQQLNSDTKGPELVHTQHLRTHSHKTAPSPYVRGQQHF